MKITLLSVLLRPFYHPRPRKLDKMPVRVFSLWHTRKYAALTYFGLILVHDEATAASLSRQSDALCRHELIHLRQAQSTCNSWLIFYLRYGYYSLRLLPVRHHIRHAVYLLNPFEIEAYLHMYDAGYLDRLGQEGATEWRRIAAMGYRERIACLPDWLRNPAEGQDREGERKD